MYKIKKTSKFVYIIMYLWITWNNAEENSDKNEN